MYNYDLKFKTSDAELKYISTLYTKSKTENIIVNNNNNGNK